MLPGWSTKRYQVDPIPVPLPVPLEANFRKEHADSDKWVSHNMGGTTVTWDKLLSEFELKQFYVFGINLLDSFDMTLFPEEEEERELDLCWPIEEIRLGPLNTIRDVATAHQEIMDRLNQFIRCFNKNMQEIYNYTHPDEPVDRQ